MASLYRCANSDLSAAGGRTAVRLWRHLLGRPLSSWSSLAAVQQVPAQPLPILPLPSLSSLPSLISPQDMPSANRPWDGDGAQLMAVPKRKVTPSRRGKRNGPKALKAIPVIVKCLSCGRFRLPHQFCCGGVGGGGGAGKR